MVFSMAKIIRQIIPLIVNATSLGLESPWLEKLSELTQGYYNQIDKESLQEGQDEIS